MAHKKKGPQDWREKGWRPGRPTLFREPVELHLLRAPPWVWRRIAAYGPSLSVAVAEIAAVLPDPTPGADGQNLPKG